MFELANLSFIIAVSMNVLLVGALYYYFNLKHKHLEIALIQQNKVLADFISHVKSNFNGSMEDTNYNAASATGGAAPEAIAAAKEFMENTTSEKIDVSDEEDNEESSDSESESNDTDSEENISSDEDPDTEEETEEQIETEAETLTEENKSETKIIELPDSSQDTSIDLQTLISSHVGSPIDIDPISSLLQVQTNLGIDKSGVIVMSNQNLDINSTSLENPDNKLNIVNLEEITDVNNFDILQQSQDNSNTNDLKNYKISELKEIAAEKGITITGKKKKDEIIALLTNKE